ncbi:hypothetical protein M569_01356, partial [Genlisea aurea]
IMGWLKKLASFVGIAREEDRHEQDDDSVGATPSSPPFIAATSSHHLPRRGFSVPVEKAPPPSLLVYCPDGNGGIQGLGSYAKRLRMDEDGDVADEFLDEVLPDKLDHHRPPFPRFEVKCSTKPARVKKLRLLSNGKIEHLVEKEGESEWM